MVSVLYLEWLRLVSVPIDPPRIFAMTALTAFYWPGTYSQTPGQVLSTLPLLGGHLADEREGLDYLSVEQWALGYLLTHYYLY